VCACVCVCVCVCVFVCDHVNVVDLVRMIVDLNFEEEFLKSNKLPISNEYRAPF